MVGRIFLGRYEAIRLLGEGGMGRVYLARQVDLGRQVVVKVMHDHIAADPKFRERFQRETLLMARFQHPYVVLFFDPSLNVPKGLVHRDLKPTNLMVVDPDTPYEKIKVMDFGLAKLVDPKPLKYQKASDTG